MDAPFPRRQWITDCKTDCEICYEGRRHIARRRRKKKKQEEREIFREAIATVSSKHYEFAVFL